MVNSNPQLATYVVNLITEAPPSEEWGAIFERAGELRKHT